MKGNNTAKGVFIHAMFIQTVVYADLIQLFVRDFQMVEIVGNQKVLSTGECSFLFIAYIGILWRIHWVMC